MDGLFLQSVEGLGDAPFVPTGYEIWERLQSEKEGLTREILAEGPLCQASMSGVQETEVAEENWREIEWHRRGQLETRLRDLNDAQDRLMGGAYGRCTDCGQEIDSRRLAVDPATSLCITCQLSAEAETIYSKL